MLREAYAMGPLMETDTPEVWARGAARRGQRINYVIIYNAVVGLVLWAKGVVGGGVLSWCKM